MSRCITGHVPAHQLLLPGPHDRSVGDERKMFLWTGVLS